MGTNNNERMSPMVRSKTYDSKLLSQKFQQINLLSPHEHHRAAKRTHMYRARTFDESHEQQQKHAPHHAASKSLKLTKGKSFDEHNLNLFEASKSISTRSKSLSSRRKSTR